MQLKSVWISEYKNLKDFRINFDDGAPIDVIAGLNGSGKSNFFEALLHIFTFLYKPKDIVYPIFEFEINYIKQGNNYEFIYKNIILTMNGQEIDTSKEPPHEVMESLPESILIAYSGHNKAIKTIINIHTSILDYHIESDHGIDINEKYRFLYFDSDHIDIFLPLLLLNMNEEILNSVNPFSFNFSKVIKVRYERPTILRNDNEYNIVDIEEDKYWKSSPDIRDLLEKLDEHCSFSFQDNRIREIGYTPHYFDDEQPYDYYTFYYDLDKIKRHILTVMPVIQLIYKFIDLRESGMLNEFVYLSESAISNPEVYINEHAVLSDGQMQKFFLEILLKERASKESLILLDEPDAFMHPLWQKDFMSTLQPQVFPCNAHIIFSTHNPTTLIGYEDKKITMFELRDSNPVCNKYAIAEAVYKMSSALLTYADKQQIIDLLDCNGLPLLLVEGLTDILILKKAWSELFPEERIPFFIHPVFGSSSIGRLLKGQDIRKRLGNKPIFGLFDFDSAYTQYKGIGNESPLVDDPMLGMIKKVKGEESYGILIPVPNIAEIKQQVYKDEANKTTFEGRACCTIEHLFISMPSCRNYFDTEKNPGTGEHLIFKGDKVKFAKDVIPTLPPEAFEVFRPMFEFLKSKCQSPSSDNT